MESWTTGRDKQQLIDAMAEALAAVPGVGVNFTQPMAMRLDEVVSGVKADVAVKIFGPDAPTLERLGEQVRQRLAAVRGAADLQVEVLSGASQIEIDIDRERRRPLRAQRRRRAGARRDGHRRHAGHRDPRRRAPVRRRGAPVRPGARRPGRHRRADAHGARRREGVAVVDRHDPPDHVAGGHQPRERRAPPGGAVQRARARRRAASSPRRSSDSASLALPAGYYLTWGGQFENQQRAMRRLAIVIPLSLVIIFLLLFVDVPARAAGPARRPQRAVRAGRRRRGAVAPAAHAEPVGVGRLHRAVRRGRAERRRDDRRHQRAAHATAAGCAPRSSRARPPGSSPS